MGIRIVGCNRYRWTTPIPPHPRTHGGIIAVTEGCGVITVGSQDVTVEPGAVALFLPFEEHGYRPTEGGALAARMITFDVAAEDSELADALTELGDRRLFERADGVLPALTAAEEAVNSGDEFSLRAAEHTVTAQLYLLLATCAPRPARPRTATIDAAMERLYVDYTARLTDVANELGMSSEAIRKQFRKHFGDSPMHYFTSYRVQRIAGELEHSNAPLRELAEQFGFYDEFHLSRVFKRHMGVSPAEYRDQLRARGDSAAGTGDPGGQP